MSFNFTGTNSKGITSFDSVAVDSLGTERVGSIDLIQNRIILNDWVSNVDKLYARFTIPSKCNITIPLYFANEIECGLNIWTGGAGTERMLMTYHTKVGELVRLLFLTLVFRCFVKV